MLFNKNKIEFVFASETICGTTIDLLSQTYNEFKRNNKDEFESWQPRWIDFDNIVYSNLERSKGFIIFTKINNVIIGFVSWDPRNHPCARIGDNCIIPGFKGNGYGKLQLLNSIEYLDEKEYINIRVTTGTDEHFLPARKMYESCGFKIKGKFKGEYSELIDYELEL